MPENNASTALELNADDKPDFFAQYRPLANAYDEMCVSADQVRPHWNYLLRSLKTLGRTELEHRWQEARRILRDNGVTYNDYGDPQGQDRPWQLDPIPLLIASEEWATIERGLLQRAELLNLLLMDLYGKRECIKKGILPIEMVLEHSGFLRAAHHAMLKYGQHSLLLYAADLVRAPDGQIWAIADHTQAPAGMGYALENRLVLSRILPSLFRDSQVHRLALFFRTLRNSLAAMSSFDDPRIVVLTPGPHHETYFEHAYLAKYLGYTLVQGADLTVRDARVCLKTLDGLQPVDVILRRLEDSLCDPLELSADSYSGVAGLMQTARMGRIAIANPLGSSLLENPGLFAFLPQLARHFLSEELLIPSPNTWWCGKSQGMNHVLANLENLIITQINSNVNSPHSPDSTALRGKLLSQKQRDLLRDKIRQHPHLYVGREEIPRSTAPVFRNGQFEPGHLILRSFLVSHSEGYTAMPGGLTQVAASTERPLSFSQGAGISKDTWVLASEPQKYVSLINDVRQHPLLAEGQGELPSRVAENMYWLGRYAERAEGTIRLLRTVLWYLAEPYDFPQERSCFNSLLRAVTFLTETYPGFVGPDSEEKLAAPKEELLSVFLDQERIGSLSSTLQFMLNAASSVRDRVSPDVWRVINDIHDELQSLKRQASVDLNDALEELDNLITALAAFAGLSMESMTHEQGWQFLTIGRRLERAMHTTHLLRAMLSTASDDDMAVLEYLMNITDSLITYRRRYRSHLQVDATLELILLSEVNPRSIGFQLERLHRYLDKLPRNLPLHRLAHGRLIVEALTQLRLSDSTQLAKVSEDQFRTDLDQLLVRLTRLLPALSDALTNNYFSHADQPRQLIESYNNDVVVETEV